MVGKAEGCVGRKYGYPEPLLCLADWALLGACVYRLLTASIFIATPARAMNSFCPRRLPRRFGFGLLQP